MHRCEDVFCYSRVSDSRGEIVPRPPPKAKLNHRQQQQTQTAAASHHQSPITLYHSNNQHPPTPGPIRILHALARCLTRKSASVLRPTRGLPGPPKQLSTLRLTRERAFCWPPTHPASPLSRRAAPRVALLTSSPRLGDPARVAGVLGSPSTALTTQDFEQFGSTIGPSPYTSLPSHSSAAAGLPID